MSVNKNGIGEINPINSKQYADILKAAMLKNMRKADMHADDMPYESILIRGVHGIGKTAIPKLVAKEMGWEFISLEPASTPEAVDYMGQPVENKVTGSLRYIKPEFLPDPNSLKPHLIVLNDMNRANAEILNALMTLPEFQRVFIHQMPKNTLILATINPEGSGYSVRRMDGAQYTRWVTYDLDWDVNSFCKYQSDRVAMHPKIIDYVSADRALIKESNQQGMANSRTFAQLGHKVNDILFSLNKPVINADAKSLNESGLKSFKKHLPSDLSYIGMCMQSYQKMAADKPRKLYEMLTSEDRTPGKFDGLYDGTNFTPEKWVVDEFHYLFSLNWCKDILAVFKQSSGACSDLIDNTIVKNTMDSKYDDSEPTSEEIADQLKFMVEPYFKGVNYRYINPFDFIKFMVTHINETMYIDYTTRCLMSEYPFMDLVEFGKIHDANTTADNYISIQNLFKCTTPGISESESQLSERNKKIAPHMDAVLSVISGTVGNALQKNVMDFVQKSEIMPNIHNMMTCVGEDGRKLSPEDSVEFHMRHLLKDVTTIDNHISDLYVSFIRASSWAVKRIPSSTIEQVKQYANVMAVLFNLPMIKEDNIYVITDIRYSMADDMIMSLSSNRDNKSREFKITWSRATTKVYKEMNNMPHKNRRAGKGRSSF